jgi:outer membrane protein assembly factor BamB
MKEVLKFEWPKVASALAAVLIAAGGWLVLIWWIRSPVPLPIELRVPEAETVTSAAPPSTVAIGALFETLASLDSVSVTSSWPRFRGPRSDNIAPADVELADAWPSNGPPVLWRLQLGDGHAGPAIRHGRVYILDYDEARRADMLRCFALEDGRELWRRGYQVEIKRNHGISRTVPAVSDRHVVTIGPKCHVMCVDAWTGELRWGMDLVREQGTEEPLWYTGQCPLMDGETVVLAPAGRALMMGVEAATGRVVWETPNPDGWKMSHSSVVPMEWAGHRMYVYAAIGGVVGVSADPADTGRVLWTWPDWKVSVQCPSPVPLSGGRLLITAGYGAGSALLRLHPDGDRFRVEVLWKVDKTVLASEQHSPLWHQDHIFSVMPNDAGALRRQLVCYHPERGLVWSSGSSRRFGLGSYMIVADRILVMDDEGELTMVRARTDRYEELARATVLPGARDSWGPMAYAEGRLLVRESYTLVCLDLRKQP